MSQQNPIKIHSLNYAGGRINLVTQESATVNNPQKGQILPTLGPLAHTITIYFLTSTDRDAFCRRLPRTVKPLHYLFGNWAPVGEMYILNLTTYGAYRAMPNGATPKARAKLERLWQELQTVINEQEAESVTTEP